MKYVIVTNLRALASRCIFWAVWGVIMGAIALHGYNQHNFLACIIFVSALIGSWFLAYRSGRNALRVASLTWQAHYG